MTKGFEEEDHREGGRGKGSREGSAEEHES
jgi:hypothetical protein